METNYNKPKSLLAKGVTNAKLSKNAKYNFESYILYLAPYNQNSLGVNLCGGASKGCASDCLFTSGRGAFSNVMNARINKTEYFLHSRVEFLEQLRGELVKINNTGEGKNISVRLNGTSDIDWVKMFQSTIGFDILGLTNIQFYDYTKIVSRMDKYAESNYQLTFSRSEDNDDKVDYCLSKGYNVAIVFGNLPSEYKGVRVVDGDESDLRFLDDKGVIVGLTAKGKARKSDNGFVVRG
jgi:hypothetical protein